MSHPASRSGAHAVLEETKLVTEHESKECKYQYKYQAKAFGWNVIQVVFALFLVVSGTRTVAVGTL